MKFTLRFNWFEVILYSFFITYGYFGLLTKFGEDKNVFQFLSITVVLTLIQVLFGYLSGLKFEFCEEIVSFEKKDLYFFAGLLLVLAGISHQQLNWALFDDSLSYTGAAHLHSIQGLLTFGERLTFLSAVPFQYLAQFLSAALLGGLILVIVFTHRLPWKLKTLILTLLFLTGRTAIYLMGGNGSPHPSFELVMPFIFGALFGLNNIALKFSYLFSSVVLLFFLYKRLQGRFSAPITYLTVLAIGTIPLFLHMSTTVEHSLWSGLAISYVFIELLLSARTPYFRMICVISLATMMRQPCFIALVPVSVHFLANQIKQKNFLASLRTYAFWNLPVLFFVPFLGKSMIYGTPATHGAASSSGLSKLIFALKSPIILVAAANNVHLWWLGFIPFVFFTWRRELNAISLSMRFFAIAAFVVFYSIHPSLWGHAKYQFEFIVPLSILGFLMLLVSIKINTVTSKLVIIALSVLCGANIYSYVNYQKGNRSVDELVSLTGELNKAYKGGYQGLVTSPYEYKTAFTDIKSLNMAGHTFVVGGSYGVVSEILNGYTLAETLSAYQIYKQQKHQIVRILLEDNSMIFDAALADSDKRINAILIGPVPLEFKKTVSEELLRLGWKMYKTYSNTEYGSSLTLMLR